MKGNQGFELLWYRFGTAEDISSHHGTDVHGHEVSEPMNDCQVIDQHHEESSEMLLRVSKRERKRLAPMEPCKRKKNTRSGNWTFDETDTLVKSKVQALRDEKKCVGRLSKCKSNKQVWEDIAQDASGRTSDQCRLRWDTLI